MAAPRVEREDLRVMDAYPGEHYPVEVEVSTGVAPDDGPSRITGSHRELRCGCTFELDADWPHC